MDTRPSLPRCRCHVAALDEEPPERWLYDRKGSRQMSSELVREALRAGVIGRWASKDAKAREYHLDDLWLKGNYEHERREKGLPPEPWA